VASRRICCISRHRPASKIQRERVEFSIVPATGLHSEGSFVQTAPKGTFKARTSKQAFFSQFLVFRVGMRRNLACYSGRKAILLRASERRYKPLVIPNSPTVRNLLLGLKLAALPPSAPGRIPIVEIIWKFCGKRRLTGSNAALYVCKVSRTVGFAFVPIRLD
jgi:hypothetical protein